MVSRQQRRMLPPALAVLLHIVLLAGLTAAWQSQETPPAPMIPPGVGLVFAPHPAPMAISDAVVPAPPEIAAAIAAEPARPPAPIAAVPDAPPPAMPPPPPPPAAALPAEPIAVPPPPAPMAAPPPVATAARPAPPPVAAPAEAPAPTRAREPPKPAQARPPVLKSQPVSAASTPVAPAPAAVAPASTAPQHVASTVAATLPGGMTGAGCQPKYPPAAQLAGVQGRVEMQVTVGPDGAAADVSVATTSSFSILDRAAVEALLRCQFRPATVDGNPVSSRAVVAYRFVIEE